LRSLHLEDAGAELDALRKDASEDLCDAALTSEARAWLQLDLAVIAAARKDIATHDALVDQVISNGANVQSRIAARLWRASSLASRGYSRPALHDQLAAWRLLVKVEDVSRLLQVSLRLAANLAALGRWRTASRIFEAAAEKAIAASEWNLGAAAATEAVWSLVRAGNPAGARATVRRYAAVFPLWSSELDQLSLILAEACVELARDDVRSCKVRLAPAVQLFCVKDQTPGAVGLAYRAVLLLRDCALRAEEDTSAAGWEAERHLLLAVAAAEEVPFLRALAG
jgi:hypothetical protein